MRHTRCAFVTGVQTFVHPIFDELGYTDLSDSFEDMKIRARDHDFRFPYLFDGETQEVSRAFGVLATPHVFIFDKGRALRYQGRFDDSDVKEVTSHDAIDRAEQRREGTACFSQDRTRWY